MNTNKTMGCENCIICECDCEKKDIINALVDVHGIKMEHIRVRIDTCPLHEEE